MNGLLSDLTLYTTFACFGLNLWFAIYLLSRSRANALAFRAIVALVALAFYYNYVLNALLTGTVEKSPVRLFVTTIAFIACHDLTLYLLQPQQRKKRYAIARGIVLVGILIIVLIFTAPPAPDCNPTVVCPTNLSFSNLVVMLFIGFVFCSILYNLWLIRKSEGILSSVAFYLAILFGVGSVTFSFIGTVLNIHIPRLLPNLLILAALILLAYSVMHDQTLVTHRTSPYDLPVTLLTITVIVVIYLLIGRQLDLSGTTLVLLAVLAVFSHSAYDFVRDYLDKLFRRQQRQIRRELNTLGREATTSEALQRYLSRGLAILCQNLRASGGFIAARQGSQYTILTSFHSLHVGELLPSSEVGLEVFAQPSSALFSRIAWLVPGYAAGEQVVVVGIEPRRDKVPFEEQDLYWLEDIAHEISQIIYFNFQARPSTAQSVQAESAGQREESGETIDQGNLLAALAYKPDQKWFDSVEDGLHNLNDYVALGESPLVGMFGVQASDQLERGKLVHDKLIQTLEKLRPAGQPPPEPLPREWYAYTILYDSYVKDSLSRDIMGKLYISEGTYYRLRRQALRGVTRAVLEMGGIG